jgi:DNA polymerase III epsilon subunit-like protein
MEPLLVYWDCETTGLRPLTGREVVQPLQLAAVTEVNGEQLLFNTFIRPTKPIDPSASEVNKLYMESGRLVRRRPAGPEEALPTVELASGLGQLWAWLEEVAGLAGRPLLLVAHYGKGFDYPVLLANMENLGISVPASLVDRVQGADSLAAVKKLLTDRGTRGVGSFSLRALSERFNPVSKEQTHDGLRDARDLRDMLNWMGQEIGLNVKDIINKGKPHVDF